MSDAFGTVDISMLPPHLQRKARELMAASSAERASARFAARLPVRVDDTMQPGEIALEQDGRVVGLIVNADPDVRVVRLPWSVLVSDNDKYAPAVRGAEAKRAVMLLTQEYRTGKDFGTSHAARQLEGLPPLEGPVGIVATLHEPNRHRGRDVHNFGKLVLDVLRGIAYVDDKQIDDDHWIRGAPDVDAPRLDIVVRRIV